MDRRRRLPPADDKIGPVALLPDEVLADVLRRLPPRGLAVSRCVCKAWLAVVHTHRLLRADLLPLSLGGFFMNFNTYSLSDLFAPLSDSPCISSKHDYLPEGAAVSWGRVKDHCNGLVLIHDYNDKGDEIGYVLNPATRWLAAYPPCCPPPPYEIWTSQYEYLAYDPTESPDFEVVSVTCFYLMSRLDPEIEQCEWPPSVCILHVFSSRTRQWEQRSISREGDSIGTVSEMRRELDSGCNFLFPETVNSVETVSEMRREWPSEQGNCVYWQKVLYVHCQNDYVMRISLTSDKYHVIKPPPGIEAKQFPQRNYPGKSAKGVYFASIKGRCRVQVWKLNESGCQMEWVLNHDKDLSTWLLKHKLEYIGACPNYVKKIQGPWALQGINYSYNMEAQAGLKIVSISQASEDEKLTWSPVDEYECYGGGYMDILGFHPCKEIIFLSESITRGLAYDLSSSMVAVLGDIYPTRYENERDDEQFLWPSFTYTPCWITQTAEDGE